MIPHLRQRGGSAALSNHRAPACGIILANSLRLTIIYSPLQVSKPSSNMGYGRIRAVYRHPCRGMVRR